MITVHNIQRYTGLPFADYLQLPGYSHHYLKNEVNGTVKAVETTNKMRLGSLVDGILSNDTVDMGETLYPAARDIARKMRAEFGSTLSAFAKQVSYTGEFEYAGFKLPVRGRPDAELPAVLILDYKVTHVADLATMLRWAKYENQQFCYGKLAGVRQRYLMVYQVTHKRTHFIPLPDSDSNEFYEEKILKFGKYAIAP